MIGVAFRTEYDSLSSHFTYLSFKFKIDISSLDLVIYIK